MTFQKALKSHRFDKSVKTAGLKPHRGLLDLFDGMERIKSGVRCFLCCCDGHNSIVRILTVCFCLKKQKSA